LLPSSLISYFHQSLLLSHKSNCFLVPLFSLESKLPISKVIFHNTSYFEWTILEAVSESRNSFWSCPFRNKIFLFLIFNKYGFFSILVYFFTLMSKMNKKNYLPGQILPDKSEFKLMNSSTRHYFRLVNYK